MMSDKQGVAHTSPDNADPGLMEYWGMICKHRAMLASIALAAAVVSIAVALLLTPIYRAETVLASASASASEEGSALNATQLGAMTVLAGVAGGGRRQDEYLAVLKSRQFVCRFVKENQLVPALFESIEGGEHAPDCWAMYRRFSELMSVREDRVSDLVTIAVEWKDAALAAQWANALVSSLNAYLRRQAISRSEANLGYLNKELAKTSIGDMRQTLFALIVREQKKAMLANTQEEYAFRVLDTAAPPDRKHRPNRAMIVITSTLIAGLLAVMFVVVRERIREQRN